MNKVTILIDGKKIGSNDIEAHCPVHFGLPKAYSDCVVACKICMYGALIMGMDMESDADENTNLWR